uniref:Uncharacterized protein n=1 Tax=Tanacetum cinerariifolium TaxID=118510 RepID=A0A6L2LSF9_TANCI|nr:hypothetical protein [Tanacetum cinerariifolium]
MGIESVATWDTEHSTWDGREELFGTVPVSDTQLVKRELRLQIKKERRAWLDLAEIIDSMRRGQEPRGDV